MSSHKRFTNERDLVRRHLKRSPALHISHRDFDFPSLASLAEAEILSAESSAEEAAHKHSSTTPSAKTATHPVITSSASVPSVATSSAPAATAATTSAVNVASKVVSVTPVAVVSTLSTLSPSTINPTTFRSLQATPSSLTISSPAPSAKNAQSQGQSHPKAVSSGVIGAVVAVTVLLGVALVAFFVRKLLMRRRAIKRDTWGAGLVPALENKRDTVYGDSRPSHMLETPAGNPVSVFQAPSLPPSSYRSSPSPVPAFTPPSIQQPINKAIPPLPPPSIAGPMFEVAIVARTFIPTLPDELHISNGEQIHVLNVFDDGWALCTNIRGEKGVVPVECLQRFGAPAEMQLQPQSEMGYGSEKAIRRLSSLTPNAGATY